jgi:transposase
VQPVTPSSVSVLLDQNLLAKSEAAWAAARAPGPLRAFFIRIQSRRGKQVAAVATARKIAVLAWHLLTKNENYVWARPALLKNKLRKIELLAGQPAAKGRRRGRAHAYNDRAVRQRERSWLEQAEGAYTRFVVNWQTSRVSARAPQSGNVRHRRATGSHS